jgi:hypothetical protein
MSAGRPPKYNNPEELQNKIDEYFDKGCTTDDVYLKGTDICLKVKRPTITGLILYVGFCNRASFYDYELIPEFTNTIKSARLKMEQHYEELLQKGLGAGAIFALKNFGWIDKQEVSSELKVTQMPCIEKNGEKVEYNIGDKIDANRD